MRRDRDGLLDGRLDMSNHRVSGLADPTDADDAVTRRYVQDQDQDSLLVKRRNDNHSPGPVIRELVPSSHHRSELSNTILCIFSG